MQSIRVDDEVMAYIERKARTLGLVFVTPNDALRAIFELGNEKQSPTGKKPRRRSATGSVLLREHQSRRDIKGAKKAYYQREGISFSKPSEYPTVFFDPNGYVVIKSEKEFENPAFSVTTGVYVADGISALKNYKECGHLHTR